MSENIKIEKAKLAESKLDKILKSINNTMPIPQHIKCWNEESKPEPKNLIKLKSDGDFWCLGFSESSIVPLNINDKTYYIGGNFSLPPRKVKKVIDEIKVRCVCLSTSMYKEKIVLACVDCIGITNKTVENIRNELLDFCSNNNIKSINVFSTHVHSSIDTMGIWSINFKKAQKNISKIFGGQDPEPTVDLEFMDFLIKKIIETIKTSVKEMVPGKLHILRLGVNSSEEIKQEIYKKIGFNSQTDEWNDEWQKNWDYEFDKLAFSEIGIYEYILAKRYPYGFSPNITRLRFEPFNKELRETMIINLAAHPYSNGLKVSGMGKGDALSGDFPYHMEKVFNENGYNFIFFNGAINGIYPHRGATDSKNSGVKKTLATQTKIIGEDFARIILAASMSLKDIFLNKTISPNDKSDIYNRTIRRKEEEKIEEVEISPVFYLSTRKIYIECTNPIEQIIGKLNFSQFNAFLMNENILIIESEISYLNIGNIINIIFLPGEITHELLYSKKSLELLTEDRKKTHEYNTISISQILGDNTILFGLANDAIGYIIPDDDYCLFYLGNGKISKKLLGNNYTHYQEIFSLGKKTASLLVNQIVEMIEDISVNKEGD